MIDVNWDEVQERADGEYQNPTPGGYVVKIIDFRDNEQKQCLEILWDYTEGVYMGYNQDTYDRAAFWPTRLFRSYKPKALPFFKAFKTCLEVSNRGYQFNTRQLDTLRGKLFGVVLGEEEYTGNDGSLKTRLYVAQTRSVKAIRDGEFKAPALKKLKEAAPQQTSYQPQPYAAAAAQSWQPLNDDDGELPF